MSATPARATVPTANDDSATTVANTAAYISVLDNDSDPDFEPIQVTGSTDPAHGSVACTSGGICVYVPDDGYTGQDSFELRSVRRVGDASADVAVTITAGGRRATGHRRQLMTTSPRAQARWASSVVLDNDSDPDLDTLQLNSHQHPTHGTLDCSAGVYCVYVSDIGYSGPDAFTYVVADKRGGTDTGAVAVTVEPNHDPIAQRRHTRHPRERGRPLGQRDRQRQRRGWRLAHRRAADCTRSTAPHRAPVTRCEYTPAADYVGPDAFTYTASDGRGGTDVATVSVDVTAEPRAGCRRRRGDGRPGRDACAVPARERHATPTVTACAWSTPSDPAHGELSCDENGFCDYTADDDFVGSDGFEYDVSDGTRHRARAGARSRSPSPARRLAASTTARSPGRPPRGASQRPRRRRLCRRAPGPAGLTFLPTGNEATAPGCLCEGWGAADAATRASPATSARTPMAAPTT